jgi:hypothetical protein
MAVKIKTHNFFRIPDLGKAHFIAAQLFQRPVPFPPKHQLASAL